MHYAKVQKEHAEKLRRVLARNGFLANNISAVHSNSYVLFPVTIATATIKKLISQNGGSLVEKGRTKFKSMGSATLPPGVARGYDVLGNIAIIEADNPTSRFARKYANIIMTSSKRITTVLAKAGPVSGAYRTRKLLHVAGRRTYIADFLENGCRFVLDVRKAFFSVRLSFERQRVSALSKGPERVIVFFAGVGPFAIELAKKNPKAEVVAIELNKYAFKMMKANIELNKIKNIEPICGDVRKISGKYRGFADRIIMPLPKESHTFIKYAVLAAKRSATIHIYMFVGRAKPAKEGMRRIRSELGNGCSLRLLRWRKVREYSHNEIEIAMDLRISKN